MSGKDKDGAIDRARLSLFMKENSNIFMENKLLRFVMICMIVWSAFNSIMLQNALDARTIIVMAPDESYRFEVTNQSLSDEYLYRMARYVTFLAGNMTAATGRDQLNELLRMIHPSRYGDYQEHFNALTKELERYPNISYVVELNGATAIDVAGNVITINTTKKRLVGDTVTRKDRLVYEITFVVEAGRFWVTDIKEITANDGSIDESES